MKRKNLFIFLLCLLFYPSFVLSDINFIQHVKRLYCELGLSEKVLSLRAFRCAVTAYYIATGENLIKRPFILTIIDYTKPSDKE
ncbi:MAG TPA: hypothetical protein ENF30_01485, partial [Candidatus Desulfofervidus auxilii]|nr:hypothetical protein [Candidatus Desulfofervidus auxilii]